MFYSFISHYQTKVSHQIQQQVFSIKNKRRFVKTTLKEQIPIFSYKRMKTDIFI